MQAGEIQLRLNQITTRDFRNLRGGTIALSGQVTVFIGQNGQGKTNLLEAIHILSTTKSFRTARFRECIRWGSQEGALIEGSITDQLGNVDLSIVLSKGGKEVSIHGKRIRLLTEYLGKFPTVGFSPTDTILVRGGPAERRAFLDRHTVDIAPNVLPSLLAYTRALRAKNEILKQERVTSDQLDPWNRILARELAVLVKERQRFVQLLLPHAQECYRLFSSSPREELELFSDSSLPPEAEEQQILEILQRSIAREIAARSSLIGIHRDDLAITLCGQSARAYASQGQARSIVLALKMGVVHLIESQLRDSPVILLDDVDSELDRERSEKFFALTLGQSRQVIITTTDNYQGILNHAEQALVHRIVEGGIVE